MKIRQYIFIALCLAVAILGFVSNLEQPNLERSYISELLLSFLLSFIITVLIYFFKSALYKVKDSLGNNNKGHSLTKIMKTNKMFSYTGIIFILYGASSTICFILNYSSLNGSSGSVAIGFGCGFFCSSMLMGRKNSVKDDGSDLESGQK